MTFKTIIDVRTPAEFMGGHVAGSINIPLQEVQSRIQEIKAKAQVAPEVVQLHHS